MPGAGVLLDSLWLWGNTVTPTDIISIKLFVYIQHNRLIFMHYLILSNHKIVFSSSWHFQTYLVVFFCPPAISCAVLTFTLQKQDSLPQPRFPFHSTHILLFLSLCSTVSTPSLPTGFFLLSWYFWIPEVIYSHILEVKN